MLITYKNKDRVIVFCSDIMMMMTTTTTMMMMMMIDGICVPVSTTTLC
jgi:hypothetical protein